MTALVLDALLLVAVAGAWWELWRMRRTQQRLRAKLAQAMQALDQAMQALASAAPERTPKHAPASDRASPPAAAQLARILQMKRSGRSNAEIAKELGIPQRQVDLVVKLHAKASRGARASRHA